jgi:glycosyltransferase involved in cell wall biosynthesis
MTPASAPAVSFIVPVYNVEPYLHQCLDSLLAQTFDDLEVICIDDGSGDGSPAIIREYADKDGRIRFERQHNQGPSVARNRGMELARGEYLFFVDSDDFVEPEMLERLVDRARLTGADMVICDYWLYDTTTGELGTYRDQEMYARLDGSVFTIEEQPCMIGVIGVPDRLFSRAFLEAGGWRFIDGRLYEDAAFCIETALAASVIALDAGHYYYYRRGIPRSITGREHESTKAKIDFLFIQRDCQNSLQQAGASREVWKYYAWYFIEYALMHQRQIGDYAFFAEFFTQIRAIAQPRLLDFGQPSSNPMLAWYRRCLRHGWVRGCYASFAVLNPARRIARRLIDTLKGVKH